MDAATAQILQYPAESALAAFLGLYHEVAAGQKGVFVVGSVIPRVERPAKGAKSPPLRTRLFAPGKSDAMGECAAQLRETANVYFGPALMPLSLPHGSRGKEGDILAVLALVLDEDADKGEQVTLPPGIEPSFIVETSTAPAVNRQIHFVYDKPLGRVEAIELAKLALRKCGGDHGGGDVTHVWRLPETRNHPDWKKIEERGRPREAQGVRLIGGSRRVVDVGELRRALEAMSDLKPAAAPKTAAEWQGGGDADRGVLMQRLTPKLRGAVHTESQGDRSSHSFTTMLGLFESGLTDAEALVIATDAPFARKYWERGDLVAEIGRIRAAWVGKGSIIRGAGPQAQQPVPPAGGDGDGGPPRMIMTGGGNIRPILANATALLRSTPEFRDVLAYNEFSSRTLVMNRTPWCRKDPQGRPWNNRDDLCATEWLQRRGVYLPKGIAHDAAVSVAGDRAFHPVREYLNSVQWDGTRRIHKLCHAYFGAEDTVINRIFSRCFMTAAVARIFDPGCKVDNVLIMEGWQGDKKSSAFKALASPAWFTDELSDFGSKDAGMQMQGVWIIELAELDNVNRSDISRTKAFITRTNDRFRPPFGYVVEDFPRQCIFVGTTNKDDYLKDETGNRRFWPVASGKLALAAIARDRDQLWAEAVARYRRRAPWWLERRYQVALAEIEQEQREPPDSWDDRIREYATGRAWVTVDDVLKNAMYIAGERHEQAHQNRVARILRTERDEQHRRVWRRCQKTVASGPRKGKKQWVYARIEYGNAPKKGNARLMRLVTPVPSGDGKHLAE